MVTIPIPNSFLVEIQRLQLNFVCGDTNDKIEFHDAKWGCNDSSEASCWLAYSSVFAIQIVLVF